MKRTPAAALASALVFAAFAIASPAAAQSAFWSGLRSGPHSVGFRVLDTVDVTRSFPSPTGAMEARPMRLYVWYPALPSPASPHVTWGEIINETKPLHTPPVDPKGFDRLVFRLLAANDINATDTIVANARVDSLSTLPMMARWRARAALGRFPVVLLTPAPPGGFMVAAELLASHGFVVIGSAQRNHGTLESLEFTPNPANIDAEVEDLEFALGAARGWRNTDARRVGVMGFSTGSLSALAFTFRSRVPTAVVAFEGWEGWEPGVPFIRDYRHYDPASFRASYLYIGKAAEEADPEFRKTSAFFDSIRFAPRWRVSVDSATHRDFSGLSRTPRRPFERSNEYMLAFFTAQLATSPLLNWLPASRDPGVRIETFATAAPRPGREEFFRLAETNPASALATLRELRQRDSAYVPPFAESSLNRLANLTRDRRPADSVILYEIVTVGYPASGRAAARLSDAYWNVGRRDDARLAAVRALELIDLDSTLPADQRDALRTRMQTRATP